MSLFTAACHVQKMVMQSFKQNGSRLNQKIKYYKAPYLLAAAFLRPFPVDIHMNQTKPTFPLWFSLPNTRKIFSQISSHLSSQGQYYFLTSISSNFVNHIIYANTTLLLGSNIICHFVCATPTRFFFFLGESMLNLNGDIFVVVVVVV